MSEEENEKMIEEMESIVYGKYDPNKIERVKELQKKIKWSGSEKDPFAQTLWDSYAYTTE